MLPHGRTKAARILFPKCLGSEAFRFQGSPPPPPDIRILAHIKGNILKDQNLHTKSMYTLHTSVEGKFPWYFKIILNTI